MVHWSREFQSYLEPGIFSLGGKRGIHFATPAGCGLIKESIWQNVTKYRPTRKSNINPTILGDNRPMVDIERKPGSTVSFVAVMSRATKRAIEACELLELRKVVEYDAAPSSFVKSAFSCSTSTSSSSSFSLLDLECGSIAMKHAQINKGLKCHIMSRIEEKSAAFKKNGNMGKTEDEYWPHPDILEDDSFIHSIYSEEGADEYYNDNDNDDEIGTDDNCEQSVKRVKLNGANRNKILQLVSSTAGKCVDFSALPHNKLRHLQKSRPLASYKSKLPHNKMPLPACIKDLARDANCDERSVDNKLTCIIKTVFDGLEPFCLAAANAGASEVTAGSKFNWRHVLKVCWLEQTIQEYNGIRPNFTITAELEAQISMICSSYRT